jgi:KUP system potassium uptake protein
MPIWAIRSDADPHLVAQRRIPSLILNYAGQAAIVLEGAPLDGNIFYRLCPSGMLIPMVGLATLATIIASQAIITGAYSMTRQAIQLGWMARFAVKQASSAGYGHIYVGPVNWILMLVTVALALTFRKSDNLASAYGIAVSLTMLMTTLLLFLAMREVWGWRLAPAAAVAACFLVVDVAFALANVVKIADGGYVPLLIAIMIYGVMWIWHRGTAAVQLEFASSPGSMKTLKESLDGGAIPRVPGTAVFLTRQDHDVPAVLAWHLQRNRSLHANVIVLTVQNAADPWIKPDARISMREIIPNFWRATATFGFMERPDIPAVVDDMRHHGCSAQMNDVTYYVGHSSITRRKGGRGLLYPVVLIFAFLERNAVHVADFLGLPQETTVELGDRLKSEPSSIGARCGAQYSEHRRGMASVALQTAIDKCAEVVTGNAENFWQVGNGEG